MTKFSKNCYIIASHYRDLASSKSQWVHSLKFPKKLPLKSIILPFFAFLKLREMPIYRATKTDLIATSRIGTSKGIIDRDMLSVYLLFLGSYTFGNLGRVRSLYVNLSCALRISEPYCSTAPNFPQKNDYFVDLGTTENRKVINEFHKTYTYGIQNSIMVLFLKHQLLLNNFNLSKHIKNIIFFTNRLSTQNFSAIFCRLRLNP